MLDHHFGITFFTEIAIQLFCLLGHNFKIVFFVVRLRNVWKQPYTYVSFLFVI